MSAPQLEEATISAEPGPGLDRRRFLRVGGTVGAVGAAAWIGGGSHAQAAGTPATRPSAADTRADDTSGALSGLSSLTSPAGLMSDVPFLHGYDAPAVQVWTPDSDPDAKYLRSFVPLTGRIDSFAPTQANPALSDRPRLSTLANDYVEADNFVLARKYGFDFNAYALRFWQYVDMFGSWHGLPVYGDHDADEPRFGMINLPNPAWSDAAHRNGVLSLGCWFWPRNEDFAEVLEQRADGSFPMADKLVEMAAYFGFDGYFINQEAAIGAESAALLYGFFSYLAAIAPRGFHVQWYDALTVEGTVRYQNEFNAVNSPWIIRDGERVCDSIFLNYWWNDTRIRNSRAHALELGLDPYEVVYAGTEAGLNGFSQPYDPRLIFPEGEEARTSWAFLGTEMVFRIADGDRDTVEAQASSYVYERQWWSGPAQDPSRAGRSTPPTGNDYADPEQWDGVAHTIVEKSVIGSYPFVTRFNAGAGTGFFLQGEPAGWRPWYNIGIQDVLPTWQWWIQSGSASLAGIEYDYTRAWDGPTSLRIVTEPPTGERGEPVEVRLFKTELPVTADVVLGLAYTTGQAGRPSRLSIGLVFADAPDRTTWLDVGPTESAGWNQRQLPLAPYTGRTIAAIGLRIRGVPTGSSHAVNLGELRLDRHGGPGGGAGRPPARPTRFVLDRAVVSGDVTTMFLSWRLSEHGVVYYDILRLDRDGGREWLARTYADTYVVPIPHPGDGSGDDPIRLELVAVSPAGVPSPPARLSVPNR